MEILGLLESSLAILLASGLAIGAVVILCFLLFFLKFNSSPTPQQHRAINNGAIGTAAASTLKRTIAHQAGPEPSPPVDESETASGIAYISTVSYSPPPIFSTSSSTRGRRGSVDSSWSQQSRRTSVVDRAFHQSHGSLPLLIGVGDQFSTNPTRRQSWLVWNY